MTAAVRLHHLQLGLSLVLLNTMYTDPCVAHAIKQSEYHTWEHLPYKWTSEQAKVNGN
jgi:hypothetical protein